MTEETQPAATPHWRFWPTLGFGVGVFLLVQIIAGVLVFAALAIADATQSDTLAAAATNFSWAELVVAALGSLGVVAVIKLKDGTRAREYLSLRSVPRKTVLLWIAATLAFIVVCDAILVALDAPPVPDFMAETYATAKPLWVLWLAIVVAAPVFEEILFRGFLFRGFAASPLRPTGAIVLIAALWAACHIQYDLYGIGAIFFNGILLGMARIATGSLLTPIVMHAVNNLVSMVQTALFL